MHRTIRTTNQFRKSYHKIKKQNKNINELRNVIDFLSNDKELPFCYKDHKLLDSKKYKDCRECHIKPDWLLIYKKIDNELILLLVDTGKHSELFK